MLIVGILSQVDDERNTKLAAAYIEAVEKSGGVPIIFPFTDCEKTIDNLIELCDGFLFSGGADIEPELYGAQRSELCDASEQYRDKLELCVFRKVLVSGKPIMGICRGMQLINVALGGDLYQDIPSEYKTEISHRQMQAKNMASHDAVVVEGTPLFDLLGKTRIAANSFHHQAIKRIGEGLAVMARAEDGIAEAVYHTEHPYLRAYQWHPERIFKTDADNRMLFDDFMKAVSDLK